MRLDNGMTAPVYDNHTPDEPFITKADTEPLQIRNAREGVRLLYAVGGNFIMPETMKALMDEGYGYAEDIEGVIEDYIKAAKLLKDNCGIDIFAPVAERKEVTA